MVLLSALLVCALRPESRMIGHHRGGEKLPSVSLALSWSSCTMLFPFGLVYGIDTLASQAYGAKNMRQMSLVLQRGVLVSVFGCVLIAPTWARGGRLER